MRILSSCKVPIILVSSERNLNFFNRFLKNTEYPVPCGQTDITKLIAAFCNSVNAPKKYKLLFLYVSNNQYLQSILYLCCFGLCQSNKQLLWSFELITVILLPTGTCTKSPHSFVSTVDAKNSIHTKIFSAGSYT
jgi:hypothetical protein